MTSKELFLSVVCVVLIFGGCKSKPRQAPVQPVELDKRPEPVDVSLHWAAGGITDNFKIQILPPHYGELGVFAGGDTIACGIPSLLPRHEIVLKEVWPTWLEDGSISFQWEGEGEPVQRFQPAKVPLDLYLRDGAEGKACLSSTAGGPCFPDWQNSQRSGEQGSRLNDSQACPKPEISSGIDPALVPKNVPGRSCISSVFSGDRLATSQIERSVVSVVLTEGDYSGWKLHLQNNSGKSWNRVIPKYNSKKDIGVQRINGVSGLVGGFELTFTPPQGDQHKFLTTRTGSWTSSRATIWLRAGFLKGQSPPELCITEPMVCWFAVGEANQKSP